MSCEQGGTCDSDQSLSIVPLTWRNYAQGLAQAAYGTTNCILMLPFSERPLNRMANSNWMIGAVQKG